MRISLLFLLFIHSLSSVLGQTSSYFKESMLPDSLSAGSLHLRMESTGFFRNNEYAGKLVDGQTWPGVRLQPVLVYAGSARGHVCVGVQMQQFAGAAPFGAVQPFVRVVYNFPKGTKLVLGNLYSHLQHQLPEPAYSPERYLTRNLEQGLQILMPQLKYPTSLFIDWQNFIVRNDTAQERFTAGIVAQFHGLDQQIQLPAHILLHHKGGQINQYLAPIQSVINLGAVPAVAWGNPKKQRFTASLGCFYHKNLTPSAPLFYQSGWAFLPKLRLETGGLGFDVGFWLSRGYVAPAGEAIYAQVSTRLAFYGLNRRQLLFAKASYYKKLDSNWQLGLAVEPYFDLRRSRLDYAYGVTLRHEAFLRLRS